jgi:hypothetical protein
LNLPPTQPRAQQPGAMSYLSLFSLHSCVLGSKSQRLLLIGEVEVLGHFSDERGGFDT